MNKRLMNKFLLVDPSIEFFDDIVYLPKELRASKVNRRSCS